MYAILKQNNNNTELYKLPFTSEGSTTTPTDMNVSLGSGDNNAASIFEKTVSGTTHKYIFTSKGFFKGNDHVLRLDTPTTVTDISVSVTGSAKTNKAKDFAWVNGGPNSGGSYDVDFIGYDQNADRLVGATITHSGTWGGSESFVVDTEFRSTSSITLSGFTNNSSGAVMGFGNGIVYIMDNGDGDLYRYDASNDTSTGTNSNEVTSTAENTMTNSSNTDGAACGIGDPTSSSVSEISLTASQSLGTCSTGGGTKTSTLSLANSSGSTAYVTAEYKIDSGSYSVHGSAQASASGDLSISNGSTETLTATVPHGSTITWRYKSSNTSGDWSNSSYQTLSASSTVDCDPSSTVSASFGTCSAAGGTKTSTLSIRNNESATTYYYVQYNIEAASYENANTN